MKSPFIEQSALVLRILPHVAAEDCFALKGGTAINFFARNMPRLSVDIDLAYLPIESRSETLTKIGQSLGRIKAAVSRAIPGALVKEARYEGHVSKLSVRSTHGDVKVEPNLVIRGAVQPPVERDLCPAARERFQAAVRVNALADADLYGGKLCAALDRQHPRDLFDVKALLENEGITEDIRKAFLVYLISHPRPMNEVIAPSLRDIKAEFDADFQGMTVEPVEYDCLIAAREALIKQLHGALTLSEKKFLVSVKEGRPEWTLLGLDGIERMPAVQWKLRNIGKMDPARHREQLENLRKKLGL